MPSERYVFPHRHLLGIEPLSPRDITALLDQAQAFEEVCERPSIKIVPALRKKLVVNHFFLAGKSVTVICFVHLIILVRNYHM